MPPVTKYSKETIIKAALNLIRDKGASYITARNMSQYMGSSPRPIFTAFKNMDEMVVQVREYALKYLHGFMKDEENHTPCIKYYCSRLVHFAILEPNIYRFIFFKTYEVVKPGIKGIYSDLRSYFDLAVDELSELYSITKEEAVIVANQVSLVAHAICTLTTEHIGTFSDQQIDICIGRALAGALLLTKSGIKDECTTASNPGSLSEGDNYLVKYINSL